jgi:hypothetical protein
VTARAAPAAAALAAALAACAAPETAALGWRWLFGDPARPDAGLGAFESTPFGGEGEVAVRGGRIELGMGSPLTGVTWHGPLPAGDYELEVRAARELGSDFFCGLTFPVHGAHLTLVLGGWGGAVCGLSSLDGADAARNMTRTLRQFATGRDYGITLRVEGTRVSVRLDDNPLLAVDVAGHALSLRPEVAPSAPLGVASYATAASIASMRWRPLP